MKKASDDAITGTLRRGYGFAVISLVLFALGAALLDSAGFLFLLAAAGFSIAAFYNIGAAMVAEGINLARRNE